MLRSDAILALLDSRSFSSIWFWLLVMLAWSLAGRRVLGVPQDVISAVERPAPANPDDPAAIMLLDWLSLTLPRWRLRPREGAVLVGVAAFLFSGLAILGFGYGLEMAQALVLLALPFAAIFGFEMRLAGRLRALLQQAEAGMAPNVAGAEAARLMQRHRLLVLALSVLAVTVIAFYAALWMILNPFPF